MVKTHKTMAKGNTKPAIGKKDPEFKRNRIQVQFDIEYGGTPGKKIVGESETVPDLNLTVRQLLQNHSRGHGFDVKVSEPIYFEQEIPTVIDMTDIDVMKQSLERRLEEVNAFIEQEKAEKLQEEAKKKDSQAGKQLDLEEEAAKGQN